MPNHDNDYTPDDDCAQADPQPHVWGTFIHGERSARCTTAAGCAAHQRRARLVGGRALHSFRIPAHKLQSFCVVAIGSAWTSLV
jgi:hypothetical protein